MKRGFERFIDWVDLAGRSVRAAFRDLLFRVNVPYSFATPKEKTTPMSKYGIGDAYTPYGTPRVPLEQAKDICEPQAEVGFDTALGSETPTDKCTGSCSRYGS